MRKRKKDHHRRKKGLDGVSAKSHSGAHKARRTKPLVKARDAYSAKRPRGRPAKIPASTVIGRANNYRYQLKQLWNQLEAPLLAAETLEEVKAAFEIQGQPYASSFVPSRASDILALIRDRHFPKDSDARINFLADSLGGRPNVTLRTSRDICGRERAKQRLKSPYKILRKEFYVECSCGYKGPARDNACRNCGAEISFIEEIIWGAGIV
jgi:hypothetical protein